MQLFQYKRKTCSIFFLLLFTLVTKLSSGQASENKQSIPPFKIVLTDGRPFNYKELQKGSPVMLIYFAPECDHCREYTKELISVMDQFKSTQIIMISYLPIAKLQQFSKEFRLEKFKNIKVGTEGNSFLVPSYYKIGLFPFTALYDKNAKLLAVFRKPPGMGELYNYLRK
ncbi:MAG: redoxin domain-containing protein [Sediminibacterium sp.]|nr:redoxin domain-containing protein [Sediminibacterium sp.]MDP3666196.1 redoxin domain-containing protein [Sediminibacterium sp.]